MIKKRSHNQLRRCVNIGCLNKKLFIVNFFSAKSTATMTAQMKTVLLIQTPALTRKG